MDGSMITVGCPHSHGGHVTTGSPESLLDGKPIARRTDWVDCPIHGPNRIIKVRCDMEVDGEPVATHGDETECGAVLIGDGCAIVDCNHSAIGSRCYHPSLAPTPDRRETRAAVPSQTSGRLQRPHGTPH